VVEISHSWLSWAGFAIAALATGYSTLVWLITRRVHRVPRVAQVDLPPVTVLKPLCGAELETYECLRSFCAQQYPAFQIVFGLHDATDPAFAIVTRLITEFPHRDLHVVVDRRRHGSNHKVCNLINMVAVARHGLLILADSDVRVKPDYLSQIVPPLIDGAVGIVTCPYRGIPGPGLWSLLGSMYINEWFMPSVRVAAAAGSQEFAFGVTIGIRAEVLARIGGFASIANQFADDFCLGEATRRLGLRTVLSQVEVETIVEERTLMDLLRHETRWLRTIRALRPLSYGSLFITFGLPVTALALMWTRAAPAAVAMWGVVLLTRMLVHLDARRRAPLWQALLVPLRDFLSVGLWGWGFVTRRVRWRERLYHISPEGFAVPVIRAQSEADALLDEHAGEGTGSRAVLQELS
jgi:ceramide glucosyltransferase